MIQNLRGFSAPAPTVLMEATDQFPAFGVDAQNGSPLGFKLSALTPNVEELAVALLRVDLFARGAFDVLAILVQAIALGFEQTADGGSGDGDLQALELPRNGVGAFAAPFTAADGIASGLVLHEVFQLR